MIKEDTYDLIRPLSQVKVSDVFRHFERQFGMRFDRLDINNVRDQDLSVLAMYIWQVKLGAPSSPSFEDVMEEAFEVVLGYDN